MTSMLINSNLIGEKGLLLYVEKDDNSDFQLLPQVSLRAQMLTNLPGDLECTYFEALSFCKLPLLT
jgi:hypothetical protein